MRERIEKITSVLPEKYKALCRLRLGDVAEVEGGVIKLMKDNPEHALRHPQVLKQLKQAAGVLQDEVVPAPAINIRTLKQIQNINLIGCQEKLNEIIEAEGVDVTPKEDAE